MVTLIWETPMSRISDQNRAQPPGLEQLGHMADRQAGTRVTHAASPLGYAANKHGILLFLLDWGNI